MRLNLLDTSIPILQFYGWWQFGACLFAFAALLSIWYHLGRKQQDFGQVWLALSVLCWSATGAIEVLSSWEVFTNDDYLDGGRSILSLLNSLFIMLALPYFKYLPEKLKPIIVDSGYWSVIIGFPFLISLIATCSILLLGNNEKFSYLDVHYAMIALPILGYVLWESFTKRNLNALAYLSMVCILIIFAAQILKLFNLPIDLLVLSAIFKTNLIMIFFALALSWVKDLSEGNQVEDENILAEDESNQIESENSLLESENNLLESIQVDAENIFIKLEKIKKESKKIKHVLWLKGIVSESEYAKVILTETNFKLMFKFALEKYSRDGWLEIKPSNDDRPKEYDIKDHNEIKRLLEAILDGLLGKHNWLKTKHYIPFKETFLEMSEDRNGKIRLKIPKSNIVIDENLLI